MAYLINVIGPEDTFEDSQPGLLENFAQIESFISQDHENFGTANEGKHKQITMPSQAVDAPDATEMRFYANTSAFSGLISWFIRNGGSGTDIEATNRIRGTNGQTMLPSGILIKWAFSFIPDSSGGPWVSRWSTSQRSIPFSTQYWAATIVGADPANTGKDVNAVAYVTDISNPTNVKYTIWRRNFFNRLGSDQFPFKVFIIAIGIP